ncbi:hypothetical protein C362_00273 [Cryptococcus neoformans Bt1]|nr:hypothetical protein C362_00273 [Cryptococcus neoformans var. grubii Bt1]
MPPLTKEELWSSGQDEDVEVNQRALIDKILARYSGEHTIFRELLQNSDDAGAQHVQVKFYTKEGLEALKSDQNPGKLPDAKTALIHSYIVSNDGIPFRTEDWQRLKKIAEGNPDEEKIGAFGVGFYSLFSVCDGPFVESGDKWMAFHWKDGKDKLLARSGHLPKSMENPSPLSGNPWTTFSMALREPSPLEGPLELARFFVTSITFMRTVKKIEMLVDGISVLEVEKVVKRKERAEKGGLNTTASGGMMTVMNVDVTDMIITAKIMKWLEVAGFSPPPLPSTISQFAKPARGLASMISSSFFGRYASSPTPPPSSNVQDPPSTIENAKEITTFYRDILIYQGNVKVNVSQAFARELERATKKPAPDRMPASIVYSRGTDDDEAKDLNGKPFKKDVAGVFDGLCPKLDADMSAKVFIGQPTGQTTGIGGHVASRFIPTVERESIDLVNKHVSHWNRQLLWVAGYLCRLIYELEMQGIADEWVKTSKTDDLGLSRLTARALHVIKFFNFRPTTPSTVVGQEMEASFYGCSKNNQLFPILSEQGVQPVKDVRMPQASISKFLPELPVISSAVLDQAIRLTGRLHAQRLLVDISYDDVVKQLGKRPLTQEEAVDCLKWWEDMASIEGFNLSLRNRLLDAAIVLRDDGKILPLSMVQTFIRPHSGTISPDMPIPQHTIPYSITKNLRANSINRIFGWTELNLLQYISFLTNPPMSKPATDPSTDIRSSPEFSEKVLTMLGRSWPNLPSNIQSAIILELKDVECIPTKMGMKKTRETYFEGNLLFDDLPIIALSKGTALRGSMEKMLLAIGVRKTVDLQLVFSRLIGGGTWSCQDLMRYLVSVKDTLSDEELKRLRQTAAFPLLVEHPEEGKELHPVRQKPWQLYEPTEAMRSLGLPVLDWGNGKWRSNSDEAKLLFTLGLNRYPPIDALLKIAAGRAPLNQRALEYLLSNRQNHYPTFKSDAYPDIAFIPAINTKGINILAKPGEVFTNPECAMLGFAVAQPYVASPENAAKLGIQKDPPLEQLVIALINNVTVDVGAARKIFEYIGTFIGHATPSSVDHLRHTAFIPVQKGADPSSVVMFKPSQVYFVSGDSEDDLYSSAFNFIDFGLRANMFLRYCGVKSEPSVKDITLLLMKDSVEMLRQAGSSERYLEQLRLIAANWNRLDNQTRSVMKAAPFLLASQRIPMSKKSLSMVTQPVGGDDEYYREWVLCRASEVVLVDRVAYAQYFGQYILSAPEERILEDFYLELGAKPLSSLVESKYISTPLRNHSISDKALALRQHVLERLAIFLSDRRKSAIYTIEELARENKFRVEEVQHLKVQHLYRKGNKEQIHLQSLYAFASAGKGRSIILTISVTAEPDYYDVASALCEVLFKSQKADEALLLFSMLTTPLLALRKRGFNVDRILNQQREEKLRLEAEARKNKETAGPQEQGSTEVKAQNKENSARHASVSGESYGVKGLFNKLSRGSTSRLKEKEVEMPGGMPGGLPENTVQRVAKQNQSSTGGVSEDLVNGNKSPGVTGQTRHGRSTKRPTDLSNIRATVKKAMDASRPETSTLIRDSRQAVNDVSESQGDYCDTSVHVDLVMAFDASPDSGMPLQVWCPRDVSYPNDFFRDKMEICVRFARDVLIPICQVFLLRPAVINIFWDHEGPTIAFNRGGTIFCNARYFGAWHNDMCIRGQHKEPWISWYFSIAHELAHNLESAHNASHEFYFSSISEQYLLSLAALLQDRTSINR